MARKLYHGALVGVSFDAEVCQHAAECLHGYPEIFNRRRRPWIDPEQATTPQDADKLREVVGRCPSGALRIEEHEEA